MPTTIVKEWLRPDEILEHFDDEVPVYGGMYQITRNGESVFRSSLIGLVNWQHENRLEIINAKLNALLASQRE